MKKTIALLIFLIGFNSFAQETTKPIQDTIKSIIPAIEPLKDSLVTKIIVADPKEGLNKLKEIEKADAATAKAIKDKEKLQSQQLKMQKAQLKTQEAIAETAKKTQKLEAKRFKVQEKAAKELEKNTKKSVKINKEINDLTDDIAKENLSLAKDKNNFERKKQRGKLSDSKIADGEHEFSKRQLKIQELEMKLAKENRELNQLNLKN
ncbi:hypothetical protein [Flavobacterium sp.]|uniref:hypothetical protein n=1 Tax=Flavobacterium sp. TaxID=239 RepID=UPI00286BF720|nr:hypothetical protein [Flavobacterium sp.]